MGTVGLKLTIITWYRRYQAEGIEGLRTRSKAPKHSPNATHVEVVGKITYLRQNYHFGLALTLEQAVAYALKDSSDPSSPLPAQEASAPLTRRAREVANLVAEGMTNKGIAAKLTRRGIRTPSAAPACG
uniref:leucine zipper domain-containing protein n=1 Tax=Streptomyces lunaelactis TaxID=1535768 RepID=UPI00131F1C24